MFLLRMTLVMMLSVTASTVLSSKSYAADDGNKYSPEFSMAVLNAGKWVKEDDVTIIRFRYLLNSISAKSGYTPRKVGDMVAKGRDMIRSDFGKEVRLLGFTEDVNRAVLAAPRGTKLEEIVALLAITIGKS